MSSKTLGGGEPVGSPPTLEGLCGRTLTKKLQSPDGEIKPLCWKQSFPVYASGYYQNDKESIVGRCLMIIARSAIHFGARKRDVSFSSSPDYNHFLRLGNGSGDTSVVYR